MRRGSTLGVCAALAVGLSVLGYSFSRPEANAGQRPDVQPGVVVQPAGGQPAGVPKYTVVETMGTNLLVVDNSKNTLYFYTCDQGKDAGEPLKLRGSIDLNQVGQPSITPKGHPRSDATPKGDK